MAILTFSFISRMAVVATMVHAARAAISISCCIATNSSHCLIDADFSQARCHRAISAVSKHSSCSDSLNSASPACLASPRLNLIFRWPSGNDQELGLAAGDTVMLVPKLATTMCGSLKDSSASNAGEATLVEGDISFAANGDDDLSQAKVEFEPTIPGPLELCRLRGDAITQLLVDFSEGLSSGSSGETGIEAHCPAGWFRADPDSDPAGPGCDGTAASCAFTSFHSAGRRHTWFESAQFCHFHHSRQCALTELLGGLSHPTFSGSVQSSPVWTGSRCSFLVDEEKHLGFYARALRAACAAADCDTSHPSSYPGERCWHDGNRKLSCEQHNVGNRSLRSLCPEDSDWRLFLKDARNATVYDFFRSNPGTEIPSEKSPGRCMSGATCGQDSNGYTVADGGFFEEGDVSLLACSNYNSSDTEPPTLINGRPDDGNRGMLVRHGANELLCVDESESFAENFLCCASQVPICELCPFEMQSNEGAIGVQQCHVCLRQCAGEEECRCDPTLLPDHYLSSHLEQFPVITPGLDASSSSNLSDFDNSQSDCAITSDEAEAEAEACSSCAAGFDFPVGTQCVFCVEGCKICGRLSSCRCQKLIESRTNPNILNRLQNPVDTSTEEPTTSARILSTCESLSDQATCEDTVACAWSEGACFTQSAPDNGCEVLLKDFKCDAYTSCVWSEALQFCQILGTPTSGCQAKTTSAKCTKFSDCEWSGSQCQQAASQAPTSAQATTPAPSVVTQLCAGFATDTECDAESSCEWNSGSSGCLATGQPAGGCGANGDEESCVAWAGCMWESSSCVEQPTDQPSEGCEVLLKEDKCNAYTECIWYDSQCMVIGKPTSGCSAKSTAAKCAKFYYCEWISSACTDADRSLYPTQAPSLQLAPTLHPSTSPSIDPTPLPSTANPSASPSAMPSESPSVEPSQHPVSTPSSSPTVAPSESPLRASTSAPSESPSHASTNSPTESPSHASTNNPTDAPSQSPSINTENPTSNPVQFPSLSPSSVSVDPTAAPTHTPSMAPSSMTKSPTLTPSRSPSITPSGAVTLPTVSPSMSPSIAPTNIPSIISHLPTHSPSVSPSSSSSISPTTLSTSAPSASPSSNPSQVTYSPSASPVTRAPSVSPTTSSPSNSPSVSPSSSPSTTASPTSSPSAGNTPPNGCMSLVSKPPCEDYTDCIWVDNSCVEKHNACLSLSSEEACISLNCSWTTSAKCVFKGEPPSRCSSLANASSCLSYSGCKWVDMNCTSNVEGGYPSWFGLQLNATLSCRCLSPCVKNRCNVQSEFCLLSQPWLKPTLVSGGVENDYGFFEAKTPVAWCNSIIQSVEELTQTCNISQASQCQTTEYAYVKEADIMVTSGCREQNSCSAPVGDIHVRGRTFSVTRKGRDPLSVDVDCD